VNRGQDVALGDARNRDLMSARVVIERGLRYPELEERCQYDVALFSA
jgi:hypothetical protein